ncbi:MAG: hypothetical protein DRQ10_04270 [Candidatus Hydrothermota bacterium]|nr:MAG: hypothetical protein DRQ10_04270 [Candidatus Hydrothermae bacterium]
MIPHRLIKVKFCKKLERTRRKASSPLRNRKHSGIFIEVQHRSFAARNFLKHFKKSVLMTPLELRP